LEQKKVTPNCEILMIIVEAAYALYVSNFLERYISMFVDYGAVMDEVVFDRLIVIALDLGDHVNVMELHQMAKSRKVVIPLMTFQKVCQMLYHAHRTQEMLKEIDEHMKIEPDLVNNPFIRGVLSKYRPDLVPTKTTKK